MGRVCFSPAGTVPFAAAALGAAGAFAGISLRDFVEFNLRVILRPDLGLWFLWVLFFIHTLFICCRKAAKALQIDERIIVLVVLGGLNLVELITRTDFLGFHWIAWYFIFFSAGVYIRPFSQMEHVSLDRKKDCSGCSGKRL